MASWWWQPLATTKTFGRTTIGGGVQAPLFGDFKVACHYTLTEDAAVDAVYAYMDGAGTGVGSQTIAASLYTNYVPAGSNRPLDLLGTSDEVVVSDGQAPGWVKFEFPAPVEVPAGIIWIAFHADAPVTSGTSTINAYTFLIPGDPVLRVINADTYPGPSDPFGTPSGDEDESEFMAYATYVPAEIGGAIVDLAAVVAGQGTVSPGMGRILPVAATVAGQGAVSAAVTGIRLLAASVAGQGAVSPVATSLRNMSVPVVAQASLAVTVAPIRGLNVEVAGGIVDVFTSGYDDSYGTGGIVTELVLIKVLAAPVVGQGTVTSIFGATRPVGVTIAGQAALVAQVTPLRNMEASITGLGVFSAQVSPLRGLAADITGQGALVVADLARIRNIGAGVAGLGALLADISVGGQVDLAVVVQGQAVVLPSVVLEMVLGANVNGQGAVAAQLGGEKTLAAAIVGQGLLAVAANPFRGLEALVAAGLGGNMVTNPSFEQALTGWAGINGATLARTSAFAQSGTWSVEVDTPGGTSIEGLVMTSAAAVPANPGEVWTGSVYARGTGTVAVRVRALDDAKAFISDTIGAATVLTGSFQRLAVTSAPLPEDTGYVQIHVRTTSTQDVTFQVDAAQLEKAPVASPYTEHAGALTIDIASIKSLGVTVGGQGTLVAGIDTTAIAYVVLNAAIAGQGLVVPGLGVIKPFAASVAGLGAVTVAPANLKGLLATIAGTSAVAAPMQRYKNMLVPVAGLGQIVVANRAIKTFDAVVAAQAQVVPTLRVIKVLAAGVAGQGQILVALAAGAPWLIPDPEHVFVLAPADDDSLLLIPVGAEEH